MRSLKKLFSVIFKLTVLSIFGGIMFVYGIFAFVRDDILPEEIAENLRLRGILGKGEWYWWVIFGLVILIIGLIRELVIRIWEGENKVCVEVGIQNMELVGKHYILTIPVVDNQKLEVIIQEEKTKQLKRYPRNSELRSKSKVLLDPFRVQLDEIEFQMAVDEYIREIQVNIKNRQKYLNLIGILPSFKNIGIKEASKNIIRLVLVDNLRFPTNQELADFYLSKRLRYPKEPETYRDTLVRLTSAFEGIEYPYQNTLALVSEEKNVEGPIYENTKEAYFEIQTIIPDLLINDVEPIYIWFDKFDKPENIEIKVRIFSADLPKAVEQVIPFKIQFEKIEMDYSKFSTRQPFTRA